MAAGVLLFAAGCRKSPSAAQSQHSSAAGSPIATPTFAPATSEPAAVVTLQVKPPASFSSREIPQDGHSDFLLQGNAGQLLRVVVREKSGLDAPYDLSVRSMTGAELKREDYGGAGCIGGEDYRLPETGDYRVRLAPLGAQLTISFSLIEKHDPMLDPGLRPDQVSIDFGEFGRNPRSRDFTQLCADETRPAHLVRADGLPTIRIMQVAGYNSRFGNEAEMSRLAALLSTNDSPPNFNTLPYEHSTPYSFWVEQESIKGDGWHGLRWVEGQLPKGDYDGSLRYVFEGLTSDGRIFIWFYANLQHPEFNHVVYGKQDSDTPVPKTASAVRELLEKELASAGPDSFSPNLKKLDAVVSSLKVRQ